MSGSALIVSHAGAQGSIDSNRRLAAVRAGLVAQELQRAGVPSTRVKTLDVVPPAPSAATSRAGEDLDPFVEIRFAAKR